MPPREKRFSVELILYIKEKILQAFSEKRGFQKIDEIQSVIKEKKERLCRSVFYSVMFST